jgi:hypothetical protein
MNFSESAAVAPGSPEPWGQGIQQEACAAVAVAVLSKNVETDADAADVVSDVRKADRDLLGLAA